MLHIRQGRLLLALFALAAASCRHSGETSESKQAKQDFQGLQSALLQRQVDRVTAYLPKNVGDYLAALNFNTFDQTGTSSSAPDVSLLVRTALETKVAPAERAQFNVQFLLQRLADRGLLNGRDIRDLSLGHVSVHGNRAEAELYFQGKLLPWSVPLLKQDHLWKVDLLSMLPYAEIALRVNRVLTGRTEQQQVTLMVQPLPAI